MFWWFLPPLIDPVWAQIIPIGSSFAALFVVKRTLRGALLAGLLASSLSATVYVGILVFEAFQRDPSPYLALLGLGWVFAWLAYVGPCLLLTLGVYLLIRMARNGSARTGPRR